MRSHTRSLIVHHYEEYKVLYKVCKNKNTYKLYVRHAGVRIDSKPGACTEEGNYACKSQLTRAGVKQNKKIQIKKNTRLPFLTSPAILKNNFANRDRSIGYDGHGLK